MTTSGEHSDQEAERRKAEIVDVLARIDRTIAELPWYGRWPMRVLYGVCWLAVRMRLSRAV